MKKHFQMVMYGEPGVGKSVFGIHTPNPFFITTDGNYEWLDKWGAKDEDHQRVSTWAEFKALLAKGFGNQYETIVVDLVEDLFKWCEQEFCAKNKLDHVSDAGYGKGYDITRNDFVNNLFKLFNLDKNVLLISHGTIVIEKDRRGVEHTKYNPSNRIPDKVWDQIEGRVRYFVRVYKKAEEIDGKLVMKRYISLVPKENEFGIIRGIDDDMNVTPHDIPLDYDTFAEVVGLNDSGKKADTKSEIKLPKKSVKKEVVKEEEVKPVVESETPTKEIEVEQPKPIEQPKPVSTSASKTNEILEKLKAKRSAIKEEKPVETKEVYRGGPAGGMVKEEVVKEEPVKEELVKEEPKVAAAPLSAADRIAAIKAKLAASRK